MNMILDNSGLESKASHPLVSDELYSGLTAPSSFDLPNCTDFDGFQNKSIQMVKPAKGTTTLAFIFKDGVIVAADSRASMGGYICIFNEAYGKLCDFNEAEKVLSLMEKKGYPPSVISHTALKEAYGRAGQYNKAEAIFRRMQISGPGPSPLTYQIILKSFVQMQRSGVKPDVVSYELLINAYGKARREEEALAVFEEMLDAGVRMVEEARNVFKSMRRDRITPDLCSYATMLSAYVNASDMEGAEMFFPRIKDNGLRPIVVVYGTLMKGC